MALADQNEEEGDGDADSVYEQIPERNNNSSGAAAAAEAQNHENGGIVQVDSRTGRAGYIPLQQQTGKCLNYPRAQLPHQ